MDKKAGFSVFKLAFFLVIVGLAGAVYFYHDLIYDFYRGSIYQPSSEMVAIRDKLDLTDRGEFLFNASQPVLNNEEDFNYNCQSNDEESAVLGCYTGRNIYVYNITEKRLDGIRELTTAHELLHAVYERLSPAEKDALRPELEKVYRENQDALKEEIEAYDSSEQLEEIYVRAGTEIKKLPENLEKHYAEVFRDQDKVVDFYNSYIAVFRQYETELDNLKVELDYINGQIEAKTNEYERRVSQLNAEIAEFNNCANTRGCFGSEYEFNMRRSQLVAEQNTLDALYDEIDGLIDSYNDKVEEYNNNAIESNNLQNIINSHVKVEGI